MTLTNAETFSRRRQGTINASAGLETIFYAMGECALGQVLVARSNGDVSGYRWGVERKRELIRRESLA